MSPAPRPPPYAADTRAKGWRFELDHERIRQSDTWALTPKHLRPWLLLLWMVSWEQVPCGSLPNDDALIAARLEMDLEEFMPARTALLRGWWLAADGRLYHDTVTQRVKAMQDAKDVERKRKAEWRARKEAERRAQTTPICPTGQTWDSHGTDGVSDGVSDATGTGTIYTEDSQQRVRPVDNPGTVHNLLPGEGFDVDIEGHEPTPEGKAAQRLREAGVPQAVPNAALRKVLDAGISVERLLELAPAAVKDGVGDPYAYLLKSAANALQAKGREVRPPGPPTVGAVVADVAGTEPVLASLTVTPERKAEAARGAAQARAWRARRPACS
jgi:hypothetical protein